MTRSDIHPGLQAAQAAHAAFQFSVEHPEAMSAWYSGSNYLILLNVPDEDALLGWADIAFKEGVEYSLVYEPDIDGHTSIAIAPSHLSAKLASLPLQGKEMAYT